MKIIDKIYRKFYKSVEIRKVKGHSKNEHNRAVDKLAKQSAKNKSKQRIGIVRVRRKKFKESSVEIGSVKMQGQRISIYIVNDQYLRMQKIHRYRYQVISKSSEFYKKTDFICSKESISH